MFFFLLIQIYDNYFYDYSDKIRLKFGCTVWDSAVRHKNDEITVISHAFSINDFDSLVLFSVNRNLKG